MKVRKTKYDKIFSDLVRERNNYVCQNCGINKRHEPILFDCAHIMGRKSVGLRYHPFNATALCRGCHLFYTAHPFDWRDWCVNQWGESFIAELRLVANQTVKWNKPLREEIYKFYKDCLVQMEEDRHFSDRILFFPQHECMHVFEHQPYMQSGEF